MKSGNIWTELRRLRRQLNSNGVRLTSLAAVDKLARILQRPPMKRFSQITPQIILGGQPAQRVLSWLKRNGVTGIINMREEYEYTPQDMHYLHLPTTDHTAPTLEHLAEGVAFIGHEIEQNGSVYIHCWEGLGRGPSMVAAYLVTTGMTPDEAWDHIRNIRPFIQPSQVQIKQLQAFAQTLEDNS